MKYSRVLLKLSGESFAGSEGKGIDEAKLKFYASEIKKVSDLGVEVAIVVGGGNIFRGLKGTSKGFDRIKGDQMGMLATTINSIALEQTLIGAGSHAKVFTSTQMEPYGEYFVRDNALKYMLEGGIAIISGGTGNPFFTTDSAAALRAAELNAQALLKGTRVDGVYSDDPEKNPAALRYKSISFDEALNKGLKIMDQTAFTLCKENAIPIIVFDVNKEGALESLVVGVEVGTIVK